jgi:myo-inositol 2-dehydrogenase/D-chiro-inositol 1-dehydrogenase
MRSQDDLHVGVLGVGRIGSLHAANLIAHPQVGRVTVWDPRAAAVAELGAPVGIADSPADLFGSRLDAVLICSSSSTHAELLRDAVARGVPAFCEKPIALDLDETRKISALVDETGATVTIGFQRRSDPAYRELKEQIDRGDLGTLYLARLVVADDAPPPAAYLATSGGLFVDQSVHDFDILRYLTGEDIEEVYASTTRSTNAPGFVEADDADTAVTLVKLSGGTLAALTSSRHGADGYDVRLEIAGSKGVRAVGAADTDATADRPGQVRMPAGGFLHRFAAAYRNELDRFLAFVRGAGPNPCTVQDAVAALEAAVAATRSSRTGRPVRVGAHG